MYDGGFSITEMLEFLVPHIRGEFDSLLQVRDKEEDEFSEDNIFCGRKSKDVNFFSRMFLPAALFLTYQQKHMSSEAECLLHDLFSLGYASRTKDLSPETHAICDICVSKTYPYMTSVGPEKILDMNVVVFKVKNSFRRPLHLITSSVTSGTRSLSRDKQ